MNYDFSTRRLFPFSDKWENGMQGELWYVWEEDAICIINGDERHSIAKGYGAALLANKNVLHSWGFNPFEFYKAYNRELEKSNFPGRYPFQETRRILYDWFFTVQQLEPIKNDFSDYLDYAQRIQAGIIIREYYGRSPIRVRQNILNLVCHILRLLIILSKRLEKLVSL